MNTENPTLTDHRQTIRAILDRSIPCSSEATAQADAALQWALDQTQEPPPPGGWPDILPKPAECIEIIKSLLENGPPPGWSTIQCSLAVQWAMPFLRRAAKLADQPKERTAESTETHNWIPALAALAKRELRFWKEAGRVSGDVTRRAASRAIEGLEQVLNMIPAHLRS